MGLDRVKTVLDTLKLSPSFPIITVAGTNGKGSVCAMLSQIYVEAGYCVGCYTSPHIDRYNERVNVNFQNISDEDLCSAFAAVEAARCSLENGDVALTYFEMGTLAAMWHFCCQKPDSQKLDICILEVGLGGRLDAVNVFEPDCTIVTSIDLDHMEYLGDTREQIGFEKAGIFRSNTLAICGDENPPASLLNHAKQVGADLALIRRDFQVNKTQQGWQYSAKDVQLQLPKPGLVGDFQLNNAACAVYAVLHLNEKLPVPAANIHKALRAVNLTGRFQQIQTNPQVIVDVAHNPHAAKSLAHNLQATVCAGKTLAVLGMLADKDIDGVISAVSDEIDAWYLADIHSVRGAKAQDLQLYFIKHAEKNRLKQATQNPIKLFSSVATALASACKDAAKNDRIIVFGSFYTVADAIKR